MQQNHFNKEESLVRDPQKLRVVLYSHDTMGLGHIRRNLKIAHALSTSRLQTDILIVTGAHEANNFALPPGVDTLVLPSLYKEKNGQYRAHRLNMTFDEIIALRTQILSAAINTYQPDVFIVDRVPRGVSGELDNILETLYQQGHTRCVLGMRDVWDEPAAVHREWHQHQYGNTIRRYYDEIWIYGDKEIYDPIVEYNYAPEIAAKIRYTGYLGRSRIVNDSNTQTFNDLTLPKEPYILCMAGGGQDGARLLQAFIKAELPADYHGLVLTGPHMPPEIQQQLRHHAASRPRLQVLEFVAEPTVLMARADCIVTMGGYNTVTEILSFGKRTLIVPRVVPRQEQWIRAQRLNKHHVCDILHPDQLTPDMLSQWLHDNVGRPLQTADHLLDMQGLDHLPQMLATLLKQVPAPRNKLSEVNHG